MDDKIKAIVAQYAKLTGEASSLGENDDLFQAGMTSHASVNVMLALEDEFGVEFPESMLKKSTFETIGSISRAIGQLLPRTEPAGQGS